jgi:sugar lactone lactonase YvrE
MSTAVLSELVDIVAVGNTLGEAVLWDVPGQRTWWTDIQERQLYRYDPVTRLLEQFRLPQRLGSFGLIEGSDRIIAAFESGFAFYQPESGQLDWIEQPGHDAANVRFNDGRVDRQGRFWAGTMVEGGDTASAKLYCLASGAPGATSDVWLTGIAISNSICFSPDGRHMYFADTPHRMIVRYDLDPESGAISNRQLFARTPPGAFPDGSHVDAQGHLWNAHWGAGQVVRYAPDGSISGTIDVPASQVSCVAFGGENLDLLFVTSARQDLSSAQLAAQPHAGDLFVYQLNVKGLADTAFGATPPARY